MSRRMANLLLLLAGATWGMGFVAQETAMDDMGPFLFIGFRFLLAALVVLPFAIREFRKIDGGLSWQQLLRLLPIGIVFFLAMAFQQIGLIATTVTNAGFLTALYVVFVPLLLLFALREAQALIIWPASMLAIVGIYLLSGGNIVAFNWGDWLIIVCAIFWALHVILVGKIVVSSGAPVIMATLQFFICGLLGFVGHFIAPYLGISEPDASLTIIRAALFEILYAGVFAGAFAFTLQAIGQQYTSQAAAAIFLSSESLFAALFGAWILSERLDYLGYLGCALIFAALLMVELKPSLVKHVNSV
ncbi:MAG: DMT family transporter [Hyphomicrobiales bacterium]|nr:DMT family transporter [Hyphomicrobiales bacterium]